MIERRAHLKNLAFIRGDFGWIKTANQCSGGPLIRSDCNFFGAYTGPPEIISFFVSQEAELSELFFTTGPDQNEAYKVGDRVEVYCDHEDQEGDRIRDWLTGIVVQVDPKMIAVQFQENVYLTDGWMVPDHVLWIPKTSRNIRLARARRRRARSSAK